MTDHSQRTNTAQPDSLAPAGRPAEQDLSLASPAEATSPLYSYPIVWAAALAVTLMVMLGLVVQGPDVPRRTASASTLNQAVSVAVGPVLR